MIKDGSDPKTAPADLSITPEVGSVRDLLTAPGLVGFLMDEQGLHHAGSAKVGKSPPPPPAPSRI